MKKILSIILASMLIFTALVSLAIPVVANDAVLDEYEGSWDVMLSETDKQLDDESKPPLPGYYYDADGFHTIAPEYDSHCPKFTVVSSEKYDIRNFCMTIVVENYCTEGDNWLSFCVWSEPNGFAQGDTSGNYGDGWISLIRGRDGIIKEMQSFDQTISRNGKQQFSLLQATTFEPIMDPNTGDAIIAFEIIDGVVSINGTPFGSQTDECIAKRFADGFAYVGVTLFNGSRYCEGNPSLSIIDVNGMTPYGTGHREPKYFTSKVADIIPSETVPLYAPAIWFDGNSVPMDTVKPANCIIGFNSENESIKVTVQSSVSYVKFNVPNEISYEAEDFSYVVVIFKNFCTCGLRKGSNLNYECVGGEYLEGYFCAGDITAPSIECVDSFDVIYNVTPKDADGNYLTDDMYTLGVMRIVDNLWQGRINAIRMDITDYRDYGDIGENTFEIMGVGIFSSDASGIAEFVQNFRGLGLDNEVFHEEIPTCNDHLDLNGDSFCDRCYEKIRPSVPEDTEETTDWNPSYDTNFEDGSVVETVKPEEPSEKATEENPTVSETVEESTIEESSEKRTGRETEEDSIEAEETKKPSDEDDIYDGDALIVFSGCEMSASIGIVSIVSIIGTALVIKKKED